MSLSRSQVAAVVELQGASRDRPVVVIGAAALGFYYDMQWRRTADVDVAVAVDLDEFPLGLDTRPGWRCGRAPHEFYAPSGARIDVVPAGPSLLAVGSLTWADGHVLSLLGMDLVFRHAESRSVAGHELRVAPPTVVAILKMTAYLDRPAERVRDLEDLAHLLDAYVDEESERRFEEGAAAGEWETTPAYLLGLDLAAIAEKRHRALVDRFLERLDPAKWPHGEMERNGPARWRTEQAPLERRLLAFTRAWRR